MEKWLLIAGGVAVFNAVFLGIVLLATGGPIRNRLLGLAFIAIAVRTGKSIGILLLNGVPGSVVGIGLIGMAAVGPLFYLYISSFSRPEFTWHRNLYLHFLLAASIAIVLPFATDNLIYWLYVLSAVQMFIYVFLVVRVLVALTSHRGLPQGSSASPISHLISRRGLPHGTLASPISHPISRRSLPQGTPAHTQWPYIITAVLTILCIVYTSQIFVESTAAYLTGTIVASLTLYILLFFAFKSQKIFSGSKSVTIDSDKSEAIRGMIIDLMEKSQLFKEQDLTVSTLASRLHVKPYVVSNVLKSAFNQTFPEFVNGYRVREAEKILLSPQHEVYSIEAIAYDCGFNTPSAFYAHFKKQTNVTPREYRVKNMGLKVSGNAESPAGDSAAKR
jgi:AraC-like DNA-binding protein